MACECSDEIVDFGQHPSDPGIIAMPYVMSDQILLEHYRILGKMAHEATDVLESIESIVRDKEPDDLSESEILRIIKGVLYILVIIVTATAEIQKLSEWRPLDPPSEPKLLQQFN